MKEDSNRCDPNAENSVLNRAADWFVKMERGLSESEEKLLKTELSRHPSLGEEIGRFAQTKQKVKGLSPDFVASMLIHESDRSSRFPHLLLWGSLAAILLLGLPLYFRNVSRSPGVQKEIVQSASTLHTHLLPDGSLIRLNIDAHLEIRYSDKERRILLVKGEALFEVSPDAGRTFVVDVDGVEIRAVGTAFNVKRSERIDVIVTHGIVEISTLPMHGRDKPMKNDSVASSSPIPAERFVTVGQRAEVSLDPLAAMETIEVFEVEDDEVERKLDWRKSLLALNGENLVEMAASFEQKTGYRLVIGDPSLNDLRIGGRFPSNDVYGFLRILETGYGIPWKQVDNGVIILGDNPDVN